MTAQEIIEKIRAEVERRIQQIEDAIEKESDAEMETYFSGKVIALEEFEFFLSTLESKKPTLQEQPVCEGLEEEEYEQIKQKVCLECPSHKDDYCGYVTRKLQRKCNYLSDVMYGYELGRQSKKRELLPMIERTCVSCPEKVKAESGLDKFTSKYCVHCSIEHCPGVKACYTSSNEQLQ